MNTSKNTGNSSASGTKPKTSKKRMKKQVRRTLGGLFLASAIAVAAIPVEPTQAVNTVSDIDDPSVKIEHTTAADTAASLNTNFVRAVHYVDSTNATFEKVPGSSTDADPGWQSKVPYIKETEWNATDPAKKDVTGDTIYVDEGMNFQFAFVQESATATDYYAVLVGVTNSAIDTAGYLEVPEKVDAYLQYTASSTRGGYCAVNRKGAFLYYTDTVQAQTLAEGTRWVCKDYYTQKTGAEIDAIKAKTELTQGEINMTLISAGDYHEKKDDIWQYTTSGYVANYTAEMDADAVYKDADLSVGSPAYRLSVAYFDYDNTAGVVGDDGITRFTGTWTTKYVYYSLQPYMEVTFLPCYLSSKESWSPGGADKELYYWNSASGDAFHVDLKGNIITLGQSSTEDGFISTEGTDAMVKRLKDATVRYIGMQKVVAHTYDVTNEANEKVPITEWSVTPPTTVTSGSTLAETPSNGVFYGNANLRHIKIGKQLAGIGDYAFYRCTALAEVEFSSQLNTIGNGAFFQCANLEKITLDPWTNLTIIGASAFEGCAALDKFDVPIAVRAIGDRAFKDCATSTRGIKNIYMCGENSDSANPVMSLGVIGYNAFENDEFLEYLEFPASLTQKMPVHYMAGCKRLTRIKSNNPSFDVIDGDPLLDGSYSGTWTDSEEKAHYHHDGTSGGNTITYCDIDVWLHWMEDENFYFESMDAYALHQTAKDHSAAFNYDDPGKEDWFEIVMVCDELGPDLDGDGNPDPLKHESTFVVDTNDNLVSVDINPDCSVITIPASIGGHGVSVIAQGCFTDNCSLKKLYIPSTVQKIAENAFRGCHNLNTVVFTQPVNQFLEIADGAFDTQVVSSHATGCDGHMETEPVLNFVGTIDGNYRPFSYAMDPDNNFNNPSQTKSYITYYSGWPTFLTVKYNPAKSATQDENELISYPTKESLSQMASAYATNHATALADYPYMSESDFNNLAPVINGPGGNTAWDNKDPKTNTYPSSYSQDQVTCAESVFDLSVPYGVESLKTGLFSNLDPDGEKVVASPTGVGINHLGGNVVLQSLSLNSIKNIEPYTFAGLTALKNLDITGTETIGDYAFYGDKLLENVTISGDVTSMGIRPFRDCEKLTDIAFTGNHFVCDESIIFGLTDGAKTSVVECLESRGKGTSNTVVAAKELAGITTMQDEAFMNCDAIETVNLSESSLGILPLRAFAATDGLYLVELPAGLKTIKKDAFLDSNIKQVSIPGMNTNIQDEYVFSQSKYRNKDHDGNASDFYQGNQSDETTSKTDVEGDQVRDSRYNPYVDSEREGKVTFNTPEGSFAEQYAQDHAYIQSTPAAVKYKVTFIDDDNTVIEVQEVNSGECPQSPRNWNPNAHPGKTFTGWESSTDYSIYSDADVITIPIKETTVYKARYSGGTCKVTFIDRDGNVIATKEVTYGNDVTAPEPPEVTGYKFTGWDRYPVSSDGLTNIVEDTTFKAQYEKEDSLKDKHHVVFYNWDDSVVSDQYVSDGEAAITPASPSRSGYKFTGWKPSDFTVVTSDMSIYAMFEKDSSGSGGGGSSSGNSNGGNNGNNGSSSGNSSSGNSSNNLHIYSVTVVNGSGSGSYVQGTSVVIAANDPPAGKAFDKWTTADATLASTTLPATTFTMPGKNVTVTANYKDAKSSSSNAVRYATGNSQRPPASGVTATGSTQVQVNKGGVSNVDLASATVKGSTDSFIVKVTETNEATNAVENALNNRYGGLDALRYWPCDISLYDSTGTTKITDTTGLAIEITLPIPDDLRQYGGNNKVAAVSNNQLEELSTRFNTVNGTPTVTFTATHFSPYVIYADTNNLNAAQMLDASPKTGDPIHPKWFLVIALFAGSIFLFLKKDSKPGVAVAG